MGGDELNSPSQNGQPWASSQPPLAEAPAEALRATVYLNGLSRAYASQARALAAFLAAQPSLKVERYVILVKDFDNLNQLATFLGPAPERVWLQADYYHPETVLSHISRYSSPLALFPPGLFGAELAGRLAARLKGSAGLDLSHLSFENGQITFTKAVYSQNLVASFTAREKPFCFSLAKTWLSKTQSLPPQPNDSWLETTQDLRERLEGPDPKVFLARQERALDTGGDLSQAKKLVVAGFGLGDQAGVLEAAQLAEALEAEWGVTRQVAMNAWAPLERLIGVSGAMTAPDWALCLGAAGAAAFLAGVSEAKRLMAVNSDAQAPIMSQVDLAIVGEARAFLAELIKLLASKTPCL